jgi:hypothetical protein
MQTKSNSQTDILNPDMLYISDSLSGWEFFYTMYFIVSLRTASSMTKKNSGTLVNIFHKYKGVMYSEVTYEEGISSFFMFGCFSNVVFHARICLCG